MEGEPHGHSLALEAHPGTELGHYSAGWRLPRDGCPSPPPQRLPTGLVKRICPSLFPFSSPTPAPKAC